jgi:hypothetical protein
MSGVVVVEAEIHPALRELDRISEVEENKTVLQWRRKRPELGMKELSLTRQGQQRQSTSLIRVKIGPIPNESISLCYNTILAKPIVGIL